jgi:hypothetical protein
MGNFQSEKMETRVNTEDTGAESLSNGFWVLGGCVFACGCPCNQNFQSKLHKKCLSKPSLCAGTLDFKKIIFKEMEPIKSCPPKLNVPM